VETATPNSTALDLISATRPLIIGHRGCARFAPENTLPSFALALQAGADMVELDYRHSSDGVPIVIHDAELVRTTNARRLWKSKHLKVTAKTAAEIQLLDAGRWFSARFAGARVPLLAEALATICRQCFALIERKAGDAQTCDRLLRAHGLVHRAIVQSFDWDYLRLLHALEPDLVLGALGPPTVLPGGKPPAGIGKELSLRWLEELRPTGAKIAVWNRKVPGRAIRLAHERGLKIWVYTIDSPLLSARLVKLGVDGIITNDPARLAKSLTRLRHPKARASGV
jgi:glycerophosphoryl diester phosphodiesterase